MFCSPLHYGDPFLCLSRGSGISTCAHCLLTSHEIYWKELGFSFTPPFQAFTQIGKITWAFSSSGERDNPSSLNFSLSVRYSNHLITFVALNWIHSHMPISVLDWGAQNCTQHLSCSSRGVSRVKESLPCWQCSLQCSFQCRPGDCWASLLQGHVVARGLLLFSARLLCSWSVPRSVLVEAVFSPSVGLHFSLLNFMRLLFAHFSSLLRSLWIVHWVWSVPSLGLLMKTCESMDHSTGPGLHW